MSKYKEAGVDIEAGYKSVELIKSHAERTNIAGVLSGIGGFGASFEIDTSLYKQPVLVSGTDGVGTKIKLAFLMDKHDTVGIDCVAMCVNDVICNGAAPKFFLDYIAIDKLNPNKVEKIVKGISEGCLQAECALVGGETAEMPGIYSPNEYDLAGFCVGVVEKNKMIKKENVSFGDIIIGLNSSGFHSNGYSLVRHVFNIDKDPSILSRHLPELAKTLGEVLLTPTRIYVKTVLPLLDQSLINGMAHITGGGFIENIPRMLPSDLMARIDLSSYEVPFIFDYIREVGKLDKRDMYNTFNMGIGLVLTVSKSDVPRVMEHLIGAGETPCILGEVTKGNSGIELC